jgi:predicted chitinase
MAIKKKTLSITKEQANNEAYINGLKKDFKKEIEGYGGKDIKVTYKKGKSSKTNITNPIADAGPKDACRINTNPRQFYLRFGYLLSFIKNNIIPKIKDDTNGNPSMFDIDTDEWGTYMYSLPNQISLDPRICIVRNSNFYVNNPSKNTQVFQELQYFREVDNGEPNANPNSAYTLNVYLNFEFILECLKTDDKGNVNVFEFLSSICTGLNKALGGINNLEPVIDETSNTLQIIDTTPIPGRSSSGVGEYTLQIYGYNKTGQKYISNFVRNVDLKTAITPEFATMVTVGATAGGYVKGTEATAFSKWNDGLTDRFKEELLPANPNSEQNSGEENEAEVNYAEQFITKGYTTRYGLTDLSGNFKLNQDAIERNLSIVTEYYKYILAKEAKNQSTAGGTIGFVPFKLNLTLDGISGIKIYNKLRINTEFLPKTYGKTADLIVTGVSHTLSNNDWTTQIETTLIPKSGKKSTAVILPDVIQESISNGASGINYNDAPLGANPPKSGWEILHPKYPASSTQKGKNIDLIIDTFKSYGVTNPYAIVGVLCVVGKESGWIPQSENLNYSKERLPEVWGAFSKTGERVKAGEGKFNYNTLAAKYAGNSEKLANFVYGWEGSSPKGMRSKDKALGNLEWGDGYKYRGRGFNQVTWKNIYKKYDDELNLGLLKDPNKLNDPKIAAKVLYLFMRNVFKSGGISNPVNYWNQFTSVDQALVSFAKANSGSITNSAENAITKSRGQRKVFDIVKNN